MPGNRLDTPKAGTELGIEGIFGGGEIKPQHALELALRFAGRGHAQQAAGTVIIATEIVRCPVGDKGIGDRVYALGGRTAWTGAKSGGE